MASRKTQDVFDVLVVGSGASGGWAAKRLAEAARPNGIYVIRFRNPKAGPRDKRFLLGYGFQGGGDSGFNWRAAGFGGNRGRDARCGRGEATSSGAQRPTGLIS